MKNITIDGKEYTLEYTIGASLYEECITSIVGLIGTIAMGSENENTREAMLEQVAIMGGLPKVAATVFYAGLLEHHGTGEYAGETSDMTIPDKKAVYSLFRKYNAENKESGKGSWMDIFNLCLECMGDDDFFGMIGLEEMMQTQGIETVTPKKTARTKKKDGEK